MEMSQSQARKLLSAEIKNNEKSDMQLCIVSFGREFWITGGIGEGIEAHIYSMTIYPPSTHCLNITLSLFLFIPSSGSPLISLHLINNGALSYSHVMALFFQYTHQPPL